MGNNVGKSVEIKFSTSLWNAIVERCNKTGETANHVIQSSVADALGIEHHTIFQFSTSAALVQGVYNGCVTIKDIKKHGNFGLGTFEDLDGEGIMLDGKVWHAKSDGSLSMPSDLAIAPFWVTTNFAPEKTINLLNVLSWNDLCQQIDKVRTFKNIFTSICVKGVVDFIKVRVACKTPSGTDLVTATSNQRIFEFKQCAGTLVGFWTPEYAKAFNVPGYHMHFLSDDRKHGGHVLSLSGSNLTLELAEENIFNVVLPETTSFLQANLNIDTTEALNKAEKQSS